jgi:hypothetical protein
MLLLERSPIAEIESISSILAPIVASQAWKLL